MAMNETEELTVRAEQAERSGDYAKALIWYIEAATRLSTDLKQAERAARPPLKRRLKKVLAQAEECKVRSTDKPGIIGEKYFPQWRSPVLKDAAGSLFTDPDGLLSLSHQQLEKLDEWRRATGQIAGIGQLDLIQDLVTNCSFVSSLTILLNWGLRMGQTILTSNLHPYGPSLDGQYFVRLFLNGCWRAVSIDDRLPAARPGCMISVRATLKGAEIQWPALLEKAYMKVMGGYDFRGSTSCIDCRILDAWVPEVLDLKSGVDIEWHSLASHWQRGDCVATVGTASFDTEVDTTDGPVHLIKSHSYSLIGIDTEQSTARLCNPWAPQGISKARVFDVAWSHFYLFSNLYLSWDPKQFRYHTQLDGTWPNQGDLNLSVHHRNQPQYIIQSQSDGPCDVRLVLDRHFSRSLSLSDFASIHVHRVDSAFQDSTDRIDNGQKEEQSSTIDDSPVKSLCFRTQSGQTSIIRLSRFSDAEEFQSATQQSGSRGEHNSFSLTAYSQSPFSMRLLGFRRHVCQLDGRWTAQSCGGSPNDLGYLDNPQYVLEFGHLQEADIIVTLESLSTIAVHARVYRLGGRKRINVLKSTDFIASTGVHCYGSAILKTRCRPDEHCIIISQNEAAQLGPFRLTVECNAPITITPAPSRSAGLFKLVKNGAWDASSAKGNPHLGDYNGNPSFNFKSDSSVVVDIYLHLDASSQMPREVVYYHLAIFQSIDSQGLGQQIASSSSYTHTSQGIMLEGIHLPSRSQGYVIVPSTYTPHIGGFTIQVYSDRKCHWRV